MTLWEPQISFTNDGLLPPGGYLDCRSRMAEPMPDNWKNDTVFGRVNRTTLDPLMSTRTRVLWCDNANAGSDLPSAEV